MSKLCASTLRCAFAICLADQRALDDVVFLQAHARHHLLHPVGGEDAHQVVFERQVETRRTRIALAAGTAAQLVVDAARFVALGADDVQAAGGLDRVVALLPFGLQARARDVVDRSPSRLQFGQFGFERAAEHDVGAAAGHVGGDGDRAGTAGLGDDLRFALVLLGVEHFVRDAGFARAARTSSSEISIEVVPTSTGWLRAHAPP